MWCAFHNALPDNNSIKVPPLLQAVVLQAQWQGRARDLTLSLTEEGLIAENGVRKFLAIVHRPDALKSVRKCTRAFNSSVTAK